MHLFRWMIVTHVLSQYHSQKVYRFMSNYTQFYALENRIGSIHRSSEVNAQIHVLDAGLTHGQRRLLSLYQNVRVIRSSNESYVPVTEQLITEDYERAMHRVDSMPLGVRGWPHIDSIRKRLRLAIVIPLIRSQLPSLVTQLNQSKIFQPCQSKKNIDLIVYHNEHLGSSIKMSIDEILSEYRSPIRSCYRRVRIFAADLIGSNDSYFMGSAIMWRKLIDDSDALSLRTFGYTHFFIMETDTVPIQSYWLDAIYEQITEQRSDSYLSTSWWMLGSLYRGWIRIGLNYAHINGNALYHLSSNFVLFVQYFWTIYEQATPQGYDYALYSLFHGAGFKRTPIWKLIAHKFRYSEFIQNCWNSGCDMNYTSFVSSFPETFLIHSGSHWFNTFAIQNSSTSVADTIFTILVDLFFSPFVILEVFVITFIISLFVILTLIHPYSRYHLYIRHYQLLRLLFHRSKRRQ